MSPDPRKLLPPDGVYAVWVQLGPAGAGTEGGDGGKRYGGMMHQGPRPTLGVQARGLEIHLFALPGALFDQVVTFGGGRRRGDGQPFPSRRALVDPMKRDHWPVA